MTDEDIGDTYARAVGGKGVEEHGEIRLAYPEISLEFKSRERQGGSRNRMIMKAAKERSLKPLRDAVARPHGGINLLDVWARGRQSLWCG